MTGNSKILEVKGIKKSFPGVDALKDIDFSIKKGEVHALIGENGAGKSTFLKILSGNLQPDGGEIYFDGTREKIENTQKAHHLGIAMVYQELSLVPYLSVAENIFQGHAFHKKRILRVMNWRRMYDEAKSEITKYGLKINVKKKINQLGVGQQQLVEIIRAVSTDVKMLLLDEPTSALSEEEIHILFDSIINILRKKDVAIIYITHRLEEAFTIADKVTVFRDGEKIQTLNISDTDENQIIQLMVGRRIKNRYIKKEASIGDTIFKVDGVTAEGLVENCSFYAKEGEIVGLSGLMGAGRTELAKTLVGLYKKDSGKIAVKNVEVNIQSPRDALESGVAYLAEDRKESLIYPLSVSCNITLPNLPQIFENGILHKDKEKAIGRTFIDKLKIEAQSESQKVMYLSGGNQQKVVLAKWIYRNVDVFLLDEPTRGIDVGAKIEVYNLMHDLLTQKKAIILISSELPEIISLSDRVYVMYQGSIVAEYKGEEITQENIIKSATGRSVKNEGKRIH